MNPRGGHVRQGLFLCLLPFGILGSGCSVAPAMRQTAAGAPACPDGTSAIELSTERFYSGKEAALSGDFSCAESQFQQAIDAIAPARGPRPEGPEVNAFAASLYESVLRYEEMAREPEPSEGRGVPDELQDVPAQASPTELALAREKVGTDERATAFDIPVVVNDSVLAMVANFTSRESVRERFAGGLARAGRYLPMIRETFEREGLPGDLAYVAMIESSFKTTAHSRAHAHGVWQFIASTGHRYGLKSSRALDERSDPIKATEAAARYFKDLYEIFNDWYLAMAAYDAGEGRVARALARTGGSSYWELCRGNALPRETKLYVPSVLAAALIAKNPAHYGFAVDPDPPLAFETVRLEKAVSLKRLASAAGLDFAALKSLNPELKTEVTPFHSDGYPLRVPEGTGPIVNAKAALLPAATPPAERQHLVRRGDTLPRVARRYGVPLAELAEANDLSPHAQLAQKSVLMIPDREFQPASSRKHRKKPRSGGKSVTIPPEGFEQAAARAAAGDARGGK